jgi:hypothetical protein
MKKMNTFQFSKIEVFEERAILNRICFGNIALSTTYQVSFLAISLSMKFFGITAPLACTDNHDSGFLHNNQWGILMKHGAASKFSKPTYGQQMGSKMISLNIITILHKMKTLGVHNMKTLGAIYYSLHPKINV